MNKQLKERIEATLDTLVSSQTSTLYVGARYALLAPAKRIRPLLLLSTLYQLSPTLLEHGIFPACSLEMIHTYSLIHDDLPCMDDDDFRRGQPTLHRVYGEATAILIGDFLLTYAFEVLASAPFLSAEQKIALVRAFSVASGGQGMVGGQLLDIEGTCSSVDKVEELHALKTAALFKCAALSAGILAAVPPSVEPLLETFGLAFGLLFQAVDDCLDADSPLGYEKGKAHVHLCYTRVCTALNALPGNPHPLQSLVDRVYSHVSPLLAHAGNT